MGCSAATRGSPTAGWTFAEGTRSTLEDFAADISRLESPGYEGQSLANLRRVAGVLHARVRVTFEPEEATAKKSREHVKPSRATVRRKQNRDRV